MAKTSVNTKQMNELKGMVGQVNKAFQELNKTLTDMSSAKIEDLKKKTEDLKDEIKGIGDVGEEMSEGFKQLMAMLKAPAGKMASQAKNAGKWAEHMQEMSASGGQLNKVLGSASAAAAGFGKVVGGISGALRGWPGMVLGAVKAIIDGAMKIDGYIKNMNKRFAAVRGPQIMEKDVQKQFRTFNQAITNMSANIRDGLNADQVNSFMMSIDQVGKRIGTLNEGFYGYRDAVHVAAKASKVLGVDITESGAMMGQMMTNMRMNLDDVDDAFVQIAFDAEKSGLSTNKFWNAVNNASASLAFYGKFLTGISNTMKTLTQTQLTGADQAATAVNEVSQVFAKNTVAQNMAFIEMAKRGGSSFKDAFKNLHNQYMAEVDKLTSQKISIEQQLKENPNDKAAADSLEKIYKQIDNAHRDAEQAATAAQGDSQTQALMLGKLSDKTPGFLMDIIESITNTKIGKIDPTDPTAMHATIQGMKSLVPSLSEETIRTWIEMGKRAADGLDRMVGIGDEGDKNQASMLKWLKKLNNKETKSVYQQQDMIDALYSISSDMTPEAAEAAAQKLAGILGSNAVITKSMVTAGKLDKTFLTGIVALVAEAREGKLTEEQMNKKMSDLINGNNMQKKMAQYDLNSRESSDTAMKDAYDDTFEKIRDSTLSLEDMKKIALDDVKYRAASLLNLDIIAQATSAWAGGGVAKYMPQLTKAQKDSSDRLEKMQKGLGKLSDKRATKWGGVVATGIAEKEAMGAKTYSDRYSGVEQALESIKSAADVTSLKKDYTSGEKKVAPEAEEMLKILDSLTSTTDSGEKLDKDALAKQKEQYKKVAEQARQQYLVADKNFQEAKNININTDATVKELEILIGSSEAGKDYLWKKMKEQFKGQSIISETDLASLGPLKGLAETLLEEKGGGTVISGASAGEKKWKVPKMANLREPTTITSPGAVILHPKESVLPADYGLKTTPMITGNAGTAAAGASGAGVTNNIYASDYLMANKLKKAIENVVREVIYQDQVNG